MGNPEKEARKATTGWFHTPARRGDRTLTQQMQGLEPLLPELYGSTVLDLGCAEGLISIECAKRGAKKVKGVEIVQGHVAMANSLHENLPCKFVCADVSAWEPDKLYDIVLMLAILHKLPDPSSACATLARVARSLCVIRFPSSSVGQIIVDERSGNVPHDIGDVMDAIGFRVERETDGPFGEKTIFYRRWKSEE